VTVSRYLFIALALSFIAAYPYKAFSHEIPFYVTYPKVISGKRNQNRYVESI